MKAHAAGLQTEIEYVFPNDMVGEVASLLDIIDHMQEYLPRSGG